MEAAAVRVAWLCHALLVPMLAGALGQPLTTTVALGALALVLSAVPVLVPVPAGEAGALTGVLLRLWDRAQGGIRRAEAPDRPGRPRPRAPGAGSAAPEH